MLGVFMSCLGFLVIALIIGGINALMKWTDRDKSKQWRQEHYDSESD